ncbi:dimethylmenaquinone methyltransferase [Lentzea aerocolonigenes]|uniref:Putative 4-hydroxy-4-methyl-2-oxoglutarate aldolase n=1 Tax=Lentzea aerocolonigenes TaxID=68170 RepID=A0A0F0GLN5_LENAE|nr:dimethylmenaquinone methyltransferase [Lentzea aerocolonigenes]KJK42892.1 dimethylmenaquinone methyltransferase [Lentzea aerocolonigenes]
MPNTDDLQARFRAVDTTAICDADRTTRVMDSGIRARSAANRIFGPAFTVRCREDFLAVLRAVETAEPGAVIVVDGGGRETALGGEMFARAALVRGLGGVVVDGGYRDMAYVSTCELPVYSRFVTPRAGTASQLGELQVPVTCGGVVVSPGDLVLADDEGLVVLDPLRAGEVLDAALAVKNTEHRVIELLDGGKTLSDAFNVTEHVEALHRGEQSVLRAV